MTTTGAAEHLTAKPPANITEFLTDNVAVRPDQPAIICAGRQYSYRQLLHRAVQLAAGLAANGLAAGDRLVYMGEETVDYYALIFGCAYHGSVLVPVNAKLTHHELQHIVADSEAVLIVVDDALRDVAEQAAPAVATRSTSQPAMDALCQQAADTDTDNAAEPPRCEATGETAVVQLYTSGTTGLPKGVVLGHRSFSAIRHAQQAVGIDWVVLPEAAVSLVGIPGFHIGGLWWSLQGFAVGATNVALPSFTPESAVQAVTDHQVSHMCVVPAMLRTMLTAAADRSAFRSLRKVVYGGSPITEDLLTEAVKVMGCDFAQIYGLTETGNTAICLPPADHVVGSPLLRAAGRPYPDVAVEIRAADGVTVLPTDEIGEVWLRTPAAMLGYFGNPEATDRTLVDGWIRTGDAGRLSAAGYLFIQDRVTDMIIVAGENVYPAEVENALASHPAVQDAAVVSAPDSVTGEAVQAFVQVRHETSPRELFQHCTARLAAFKVPRAYHFVSEIPRNPSGKILRRVLRDPLWGSAERKVN